MKLKTHLHRIQVATVSTLLTLVATLPTTQAQESGMTHAAGAPVIALSLPDSVLRGQIAALPATAQVAALSKLRNISFSSADLPYLRTDRNGGIYIEDHFDIPAYLTNEPQAIAPLYQNITPTEAFSLHSKPGAPNTIYIDVNGHVVTGTAWNNAQWNSTAAPSYTALPYDLDGNAASFSDSELASIAQIWRRTAEDYAPFNVDVTTQEPVSFVNTARALITKNVDQFGVAMPSSSAGGVAYLNVWGDNYASPAFIYYNNLANGRADIVSEAVSHEIGHNLGLSHDGTSTQEYYGGHGTGNTSWGPIMGTGYNRNVSQWSKGEYIGANNPQDDINIIASYLTNRTDDHSDTSEGATPIVTDAAGNIVSTTPVTDPSNATPINKGIISTQGDRDTFQFDTTGGTVTLNARSFQEISNTHGGNLDIQLILRDSLGALVADNDYANDTNATITTSLAAGRYYLTVDGGDDPTSPYSDYGSLGQYFLSGNIPQTANNDTTPDAFTFTDQSNVALSTAIVSAPISLSGIDAAANISVSGGEYSINGGVYTATAGTVSNTASVTVRHTSSANYVTNTDTILTIGGVADKFTSTTLPAPIVTHTLNVTKTGTGSGTVTSTPAGISCGTDCTETYPTSGKIIKLTAVVGTNSLFTGWSGACSGTSTTCNVTVTNLQNVTANFNYITYDLTTAKVGNGIINSSPAGIDCGTDCTEVVNKGSTITLTATPDAGYKFMSWTGCTSTTNVCTITMTAAKTVTANFKAVFPLTVSKTGTGTGTVKATGINCDTTPTADCNETYLKDTNVSLTATATTGSRFIGWAGACSGSTTCTVAINDAKNVTATFDIITYKLTVTKVGNGNVVGSILGIVGSAGISCGTSCEANIPLYSPALPVTLTATADPGYKFMSWTGCTSTTNACIVTMNAAKSVTATFKAVFPLTVSKTGTGTGTVKATGINCDTTPTADCNETYLKDTNVSLTATATTGSRFTGWSGACTGSTTCTVAMTDAKNVTANFDIITNKLTVTKVGNGNVVGSIPGVAGSAGISCGATCEANFPLTSPVLAVTLTATADTGYKFTGWTGGCTGTATTCTVSMSAAKTVTATFKPLFTLTVNKVGTGTGTVTSTPLGIDCGNDCTEDYLTGTAVTLTAKAATGSRFTGWSGSCAGTSTTCRVTLSAAAAAIANFVTP
jgi:uncharacterized repeat protein (TIGR02543 family)